MEQQAVTTAEFAIPKSKFLVSMAMRYARIPLYAIAAAIAACALLGCVHDLRWIIVCLMLALIIAPMAAVFLYFNYGLRPEGFVNVLPHRVTIRPGEIDVEAYFAPLPDFKDEDKDNDKDNDNGEAVETKEVERKAKVYKFAYQPHKPYRTSTSAIYVNLAEPHHGFVTIPFAAFADATELEKAVAILLSLRQPGGQTRH
ncbi:MAG TPA: hypothetical protein DC009_05625 [Porphyromonadaceae bacterium]|nr:hypothetical protein [Porphyromonadaceae bacterium]